MQMGRVSFLRVVNSSERLRDLLATSIQIGVRQVLGWEMRLSEARDLARVHTLSSAISEIKEKIHVHEGLQDPKRRTELAIHETIVSGPQETQLTGHHLDTIVRSREVTLGLQTARSSMKTTVSDILRLQKEISTWGDDYRRFLRSVYRLYSIRSRELEALNLGTMQARKAAADLDELFMDALDQSQRLR
jgi:hypothetical protein